MAGEGGFNQAALETCVALATRFYHFVKLTIGLRRRIAWFRLEGLQVGKDWRQGSK